MPCSSAIYTVNSNVVVAANGGIPLGSVIRRMCDHCQLQGSDIVCCGRGYYDVDCSVTLTPTAAGEVGVQLYADGSPVPGAVAFATGTAGSALSLAVTAIVRQRCEGATSLSLGLVSGDATTGATIDNVAVTVVRL